MRFNPKVCGTFADNRAKWLLCFVILFLSVGWNSAEFSEEAENLSPNENQEGNSWDWSVGGWFSIGGWSSSWRSMVSGTRSVFRWRFGNVEPETAEEEAVESVTETKAAPRRCERLTMDACRGLGYDATSMPNLLNHESQDIAQLELAQYDSLVRVNCSSDMRFFLCALHAPKCTEGVEESVRLPPCRPACERIKSRCNVVMEKFHYEWPSIFECENYPDQLQGHCTGQ